MFVYAQSASARPQGGDCLAGTEIHFFGGVEVVACDSGAAQYKVISETDDRSPCGSRPEGVEIVETTGVGLVEWAVCAVPL